MITFYNRYSLEQQISFIHASFSNLIAVSSDSLKNAIFELNLFDCFSDIKSKIVNEKEACYSISFRINA